MIYVIITNVSKIIKDDIYTYGLTNSFLKDMPLFKDVAEDFIKFIGDDLIVVYDEKHLRLLNKELSRLNLPILKNYFFDIHHYALIQYAQQYSLYELCIKYNVAFLKSEERTAVKDCYLLCSLYSELKKQHEEHKKEWLDFSKIWFIEDEANKTQIIDELKRKFSCKNDGAIFMEEAQYWRSKNILGKYLITNTFSADPCDLIGEEWRPARSKKGACLLTHRPKKIKHILQDKIQPLEVSNYGRIGIALNASDLTRNEYQICENEGNKEKKCHYILPQREKCDFNPSKNQFEQYSGYLVVDILSDIKKKLKEEYVYRIVAYSWCDNLEKTVKKNIHHINNDRHNNSIENLIFLSKEDYFAIHRKI